MWITVVRAGCFLIAAAAGAQDFVRQTPADRWREYSREAFASPGAAARVVFPALINHWDNEPPEWGVDAEALGKRTANKLAKAQLQSAMYHASAAAVGFQTGYRRCACPETGRRIGHAITRTLITYDRGGRRMPNLPLLASYYGGNMIATTWYPERLSPVKDGLRWGSYQVGFSMALNVLREFSPEIRRVIRIGGRPKSP